MDISAWPSDQKAEHTLEDSKFSQTERAKTSKSKYEAMLKIFSSKKRCCPLRTCFPRTNYLSGISPWSSRAFEGRSETKKCILLLDKRVWHEENAPPHSVVLVRQFLMQEQILLTEHSPCSPSGSV
jgi:hypothetical protein